MKTGAWMRIVLVGLLALAFAGLDCGAAGAGAPEAPWQHPAFPGQTRAPSMSAGVRFQVATLARGLDHPWSLAFLPGGAMLVTERVGRLRLIGPGGALSGPIAGVPKVQSGGQGGLFDVALDPHFTADHLVYLAYLEPRRGGAGLTVARARLVRQDGGGSLEGLQVIFRAQPAAAGSINLGGRLVFLGDGTLIVTVGDRFTLASQAQSLASDLGKLVRIRPNGSVPPDNPFVGRPGARPEIWALGVRNSEGAAIDPADGKLWLIDHGAAGGDRVIVAEKGRNYGWPVIAYGVNYNGSRIGVGTARRGFTQPIYYWDPDIAPSGMVFYDGRLAPAWRGSLFIGALRGEDLVRLTLNGARVLGEERLLGGLHERLRDVREGPDGALYLLTDSSRGRLLRLAPVR
ncbi:MAG TPA: PQQ-dependent sugar dehydrogenase [Caulobacteraceae bacterium]|nr:PQQ-dependent sugar dehydrogenase [Caulobacteraceae bacterium]